MMFRNMVRRGRVLHWIIALYCIVFLAALFFYGTRIGGGDGKSDDSPKDEQHSEAYLELQRKYLHLLEQTTTHCEVQQEKIALVSAPSQLDPFQNVNTNTSDPDPYIVIAIHVSDKERYESVRKTWAFGMLQEPQMKLGTKTAKVLFFSGILTSKDGVDVNLTYPLDMNAWDKTKSSFSHMYDTYPNAKWYMKIDDDTYLYSRNLIEVLARYDSNQPHYIGYPISFQGQFTFGSGGAGYVLSNKALSIARPRFHECKTIGTGMWNGPYEDVSMGRCLLDSNIPLTDVVGFHPHNPEQMLLWDKTGHSSDHLRAEPEDASSYLKPITYHYITPQRMFNMYDPASDYFRAPLEAIKTITTSTTTDETSTTTCTTTKITLKTEKKRIPKILHQIWLGDQSKRPVVQMDSCKNANPNWEYKLWTEEEIKNSMPAFINKDHFDRAHQRYMQSDILRYELLYQFGGMYIDADSFCLKPLDDLVDNMFNNNYNHTYDAFAAYENEQFRGTLVANGVMGAVQYSPSMLVLIRDLHKTNWHDDAWISTGPAFLTNRIEKYHLKVGILPSITFYPYHHSNINTAPKDNKVLKQELEKKGSYTFQQWGSSFNAYGSLRDITN